MPRHLQLPGFQQPERPIETGTGAPILNFNPTRQQQPPFVGGVSSALDAPIDAIVNKLREEQVLMQVQQTAWAKVACDPPMDVSKCDPTASVEEKAAASKASHQYNDHIGKIMAAIDSVNAMRATADTTVSGLQGQVAALQSQVAALQSQILHGQIAPIGGGGAPVGGTLPIGGATATAPTTGYSGGAVALAGVAGLAIGGIGGSMLGKSSKRRGGR